MRVAEIERPPVQRIALVQLAILVPLCLVLAAFSKVVAYSVASGGLVAIVPQAWFAAKAFSKRGASDARDIARNSYAGEVGKFFLSCAGFAIVFSMVRPVNGPLVFAGFLVMLTIQIVGSWWLLRQRPVK
jgi:ATP synthase protein I